MPSRDVPPYHLDADAGQVQLWSTAPLPFAPPTNRHPRAWLRDMRRELREAIAGLQAHPTGLLHAMCAATAYPAGTDVENTLLYNLGSTGCFSSLCAAGLFLERRDAAPPACPVSLCGQCIIHYLYRTVPADPGLMSWRKGRLLASWFGVPLPPLRTSTKPAAVWAALKRHSEALEMGAPGPPCGRFGVAVHLAAPDPANLAGLIKPLLDGTISAFHSHEDDREPTELCAGRVAPQVGDDERTVAAWLADTRLAVLGTRRLLYPRACGVQWNPADDACVAIALTAGPSPDATWRCSGEVFGVQANTRA